MVSIQHNRIADNNVEPDKPKGKLRTHIQAKEKVNHLVGIGRCEDTVGGLYCMVYMSSTDRELASGTKVNIASGSIAIVHSLENLVGGAESGNVWPVLLNRNSSSILWYRSACPVRFE